MLWWVLPFFSSIHLSMYLFVLFIYLLSFTFSLKEMLYCGSNIWQTWFLTPFSVLGNCLSSVLTTSKEMKREKQAMPCLCKSALLFAVVGQHQTINPVLVVNCSFDPELSFVPDHPENPPLQFFSFFRHRVKSGFGPVLQCEGFQCHSWTRTIQ